MMNRRRMMMLQQVKRIRTELEINGKNVLLCKIGSRSFYKVNDGLAICAIIRSSEFWLPFLVSEQQSAVTYTANMGNANAIATIDYDGTTYHVSNYGFAVRQTNPINENPFNLPVLNDVLNKETYPNTVEGQQQATKDLLDYYFGKV